MWFACLCVWLAVVLLNRLDVEGEKNDEILKFLKINENDSNCSNMMLESNIDALRVFPAVTRLTVYRRL